MEGRWGRLSFGPEVGSPPLVQSGQPNMLQVVSEELLRRGGGFLQIAAKAAESAKEQL